MFLVFNKDKVQTYMVSILTVAVLIAVANINNIKTITTSATLRSLPIYNVKTDEKKVAFTMNCAWNADDIDSILETLKSNDVKITFFMVGNWVDEAGHEIGSHSNTHPHVNNLSSEKNLEEIKLSVKKIENLTGSKVELYRTPYGEYNDIVIQTAKENGYYPIQWDLDTLDYKGLTGDEMWNRIKNKLKNGSIILSHNGTKHTSDSLDMLIKNIKKQGYEITTVSNLIYKDGFSIDNNGTQIKN